MKSARTSSFSWFIAFLASFIVVDITNTLIARSLNNFGLVPRSVDHWYGILTAPWLHGNLEHMFTNLTALVVLATLTWQWGPKVFWKSTLTIIIGSGICVWLIGRPAYHIGASGLVYGYFGFCILAGWLSRSFYRLLISVLVIGLYGSMLWGVLVIKQGVSFEFHFAGFILGLLCARKWAKST